MRATSSTGEPRVLPHRVDVGTGLPPGDVLEMTQDLEGYLWLGTTGGLVRFDGSQFEIWGSRGEAPLPGLAVTALVAARNGSMWVAFGDTAGGVSQIRDGRVMGYTERDGLPKGPIAALLEDRRGTIWVGGRGGSVTISCRPLGKGR